MPKQLTESHPVEVLVIRLDEPVVECIACGAETTQSQGLPMREGQFLENDDTGEWGGFSACRDCWNAHTVGGVTGLMRRLGDLMDKGNTMARDHWLSWAAGIYGRMP